MFSNLQNINVNLEHKVLGLRWIIDVKICQKVIDWSEMLTESQHLVEFYQL